MSGLITGVRSLQQGHQPYVDKTNGPLWIYEVPGDYTFTVPANGVYLFYIQGGGGGGGIAVEDGWLTLATGGSSGTCGYTGLLLNAGETVAVHVGPGGAGGVVDVLVPTAAYAASGAFGYDSWITAPRGYFADTPLKTRNGLGGHGRRANGTFPIYLAGADLPDLTNMMNHDLFTDGVQSSGITCDANGYYFDSRSAVGYGQKRTYNMGVWPEEVYVGYVQGDPMGTFRVCATAGAPPRSFPPFPVGNGGSPYIYNISSAVVATDDVTNPKVVRNFMPPKWGGGGGGTCYYRNSGANARTGLLTGQKGADGVVMILKVG